MAAMTTFASIADYDARFPGRTVSDETLTACLEDATVAIQNVLGRHGIDWEHPDAGLGDRMMRTCRSVADRILPKVSDVPYGVTQASITAVGFQQSYSFGSAYGIPKLNKGELDMLGLRGSGFGWAPLGGNDA